jgi:orotate phosphoribosyltransferase
MERDFYLSLWKLRDGLYICPKTPDGQRLGPLVGYAGRDRQGRQFVGDVYANFSKVEPYNYEVVEFAKDLIQQLQAQTLSNVVLLAAPLGGIKLADAMGFAGNLSATYLEKKVTAVASATTKEKSELVVGRHEIWTELPIVLVEDVVNNLSTPRQAIPLIEGAGGNVVAIACALNRSPVVAFDYHGRSIPIVSVLRMEFDQWEQDHPDVAADIEAGNVILNPKLNWAPLAEAMNKTLEG